MARNRATRMTKGMMMRQHSNDVTRIHSEARIDIGAVVVAMDGGVGGLLGIKKPGRATAEDLIHFD